MVRMRHGWSTFFLHNGEILEKNAIHTSQTAELLRQIPFVHMIFFSIFEPDVHLKAHWGYYKGFLLYHLRIIVPNNNHNETCWIRTNINVKLSPQNKQILQEQLKQEEKAEETSMIPPTTLTSSNTTLIPPPPPL